MSRVRPEALRLCLVTEPDLLGGRALVDVACVAVAGGATMVQLREKKAPTRLFLERARALAAALRSLGVPLIVNDRVDIALASGADGVHLGQSDMPVGDARAILGAGVIIGLSIEVVAQAREPDAALADYLGVGPVFATGTKPDAAPPLGLDGLAGVRAASDRPILAIGGLRPEHGPALRRAGADGAAVVSGLMAAPDIAAAARAYRLAEPAW